MTNAAEVQSDSMPSLSKTILAGCAAGLLAWGVGEAFVGRYAPPSHLYGLLERSAELAKEQREANVKNAMIAFGILGASLGGVLALLSGNRRGSSRVATGLLGLFLAAVAGVGLSIAVVPRGDANLLLFSENLLAPILLHAAIWGPVAAIAGGFLGWTCKSTRGILPGALGGFVGAILGTTAFDLLGAAVFPLDSTNEAISKSVPSRFSARLLVCLCAAAGTHVGLGVPRAAKSASEASH